MLPRLSHAQDCAACDRFVEGPLESFQCLYEQLDGLIEEATRQSPILVRLSCSAPEQSVDFKYQPEVGPIIRGPDDNPVPPSAPAPAYILSEAQLRCLGAQLAPLLETQAEAILRFDLGDCPQ